jgi:Leucine-rich repeat (LRR) protein
MTDRSHYNTMDALLYQIRNFLILLVFLLSPALLSAQRSYSPNLDYPSVLCPDPTKSYGLIASLYDEWDGNVLTTMLHKGFLWAVPIFHDLSYNSRVPMSSLDYSQQYPDFLDTYVVANWGWRKIAFTYTGYLKFPFSINNVKFRLQATAGTTMELALYNSTARENILFNGDSSDVNVWYHSTPMGFNMQANTYYSFVATLIFHDLTYDRPYFDIEMDWNSDGAYPGKTQAYFKPVPLSYIFCDVAAASSSKLNLQSNHYETAALMAAFANLKILDSDPLKATHYNHMWLWLFNSTNSPFFGNYYSFERASSVAQLTQLVPMVDAAYLLTAPLNPFSYLGFSTIGLVSVFNDSGSLANQLYGISLRGFSTWSENLNPFAFEQLTVLRCVDLDDIASQGTIPDFGNNLNLRILRYTNLWNLVKPISNSLNRLTKLQWFKCNYCGFGQTNLFISLTNWPLLESIEMTSIDAKLLPDWSQNKQLKRLVCSSCSLFSVPNSGNINFMTKLQLLYLSDNAIKFLDALVLPGLLYLNVRGNPLLSLPRHLEFFLNLRYLDVGGSTSNLGAFPSNFLNLINLQFLAADGSGVSNFTVLNSTLLGLAYPEIRNKTLAPGAALTNFSLLPRLKQIYLYDNHLVTIPSYFCQFFALAEWFLQDNSITNLPDCSAVENGWQSLTYLNLQNNNLTKFYDFPSPSSSSLLGLGLSNNPTLAYLAQNLDQLPYLAYLDLSNCNLNSVFGPEPKNFLNFTAPKFNYLASLSLNNNNLGFFPPTLPYGRQLNELRLSGNKISELPSETYLLNGQNLRSLDLSNNSLSNSALIGSALAQLTGLESLYLQFNNLSCSRNSSVPNICNLFNLYNLDTANIGYNPLGTIPTLCLVYSPG